MVHHRTTPNAGIGVPNPGSTWSLRSTASSGASDVGTFRFGLGMHVVSDWNGDGLDDIGTFDPTIARWSLRFGASAGPANAGTFEFGQRYTQPVVGDWDGDGKDGIGTFNLLTTAWTLRQTATAGPASSTFAFGKIGSRPVTGDWNGDGKDGIGFYDRSNGRWSLPNEASAGVGDVGTFNQGDSYSIPVVGDFTTSSAGTNGVRNLTVKPLDVDLPGLKVASSPITATVRAEAGLGKLVDNLLTTVGSVVNMNKVT